MELCSGGDLASYVKKRNRIKEKSARHFFVQLIQGLVYLHSKKILHRDLKLENLMLDAQGNVKIVDFGVSKQLRGN
jgi:serine/threonine protein kinase